MSETTDTCFHVLEADGITSRKLCFGTDQKVYSGLEIETKSSSVGSDLDFVWILVCAFLVMYMQLGFTLLEAGTVRVKNVLNIMFKNFVDFCLGALVWYFFGWGFANPKPGDAAYTNEFVGWGDFTLDKTEDHLNWFFSMVFAATAATIVSGAVAERTTLLAYMVYSIIITGWVYPVVVYWVWSGTGWLSAGKEYQMIDFAGSGVVHAVGGFSGLVGAAFLGKRSGHPIPFSVGFQVMGVFILFFGWFGFNCGSTLAAQDQMQTAARVAMTTTLSAVSAGLSAVILSYFIEGALSLERMGNGILGGLVSITAGCHVVKPWAAVCIGLLGGGIFYGSSMLMVKLGIDDPLDAAAVHGFCGIWGVMAIAFFGLEDYMDGYEFEGKIQNWGTRFRNQFVGIFTIVLWTCAWATVMFGTLKMLGLLRVDEETEKSGMNVKHSSRSPESAVPFNFRSSQADLLKGSGPYSPKSSPTASDQEQGGAKTWDDAEPMASLELANQAIRIE